MVKRRPKTRQPERVLGWLQANDGYHTPRDVADGTGLTTHQVANVLSDLSRKGRVERQRHETIKNGPGSSLYRLQHE